MWAPPYYIYDATDTMDAMDNSKQGRSVEVKVDSLSLNLQVGYPIRPYASDNAHVHLMDPLIACGHDRISAREVNAATHGVILDEECRMPAHLDY